MNNEFYNINLYKLETIELKLPTLHYLVFNPQIEVC